jgi:hypothetical protein
MCGQKNRRFHERRKIRGRDSTVKGRGGAFGLSLSSTLCCLVLRRIGRQAGGSIFFQDRLPKKTVLKGKEPKDDKGLPRALKIARIQEPEEYDG